MTTSTRLAWRVMCDALGAYRFVRRVLLLFTGEREQRDNNAPSTSRHDRSSKNVTFEEVHFHNKMDRSNSTRVTRRSGGDRAVLKFHRSMEWYGYFSCAFPEARIQTSLLNFYICLSKCSCFSRRLCKPPLNVERLAGLFPGGRKLNMLRSSESRSTHRHMSQLKLSITSGVAAVIRASSHEILAQNWSKLTLWRPLLPYGYSCKASCARRLNWSGTECFKQYSLATVGVKGLTTTTVNLQKLIYCRLKVPQNVTMWSP